MNDAQPASPVTSPGTSTTAGVFSQVRTATDDRLNRTVSGFNRLPNVIASGRAAVPQAVISNDMVAAIEAYSPKPGRQMARSMNLDVQNTPPPQVDSVIDAIQRYLDIKPRREPTADPKAEASVARHPQQIIESGQRWDDASRYQFASNGVEMHQFRPEYHAWAGSLDLTVENEGSADIYAPPTRSPMSGASGTTSTLGENVVYDPVNAAQATMGQMLEVRAPSREYLTSGAPMLSEDPYFDPTCAAQNAAARLRAAIDVPAEEPLTVGPSFGIQDPVDAARSAMSRMAEVEAPTPRFFTFGAPAQSENPYFNPAEAARNAAVKLSTLLNSPEEELLTVGPSNVTDDPEKDPVHIAENIVAENTEKLEQASLPRYTVGAPNMVDNVQDQPQQAWYASTQVAYGLGRQSGINLAPAASFRPMAENQAYIRSMHILDGMSRAFVIAGKA